MPTLGLRGPPPSQPVPRTELLLLGWRLPSLVATPPDGELRLLPLVMRTPCNIAVDPRLCKGSVFADRRKKVEEYVASAKSNAKEERYRVSVLRSRLEHSLPHVPSTASTTRNGYKNGYKNGITSAQKSPSPKLPVQLPKLSPTSIDKGFRKIKFVPLTNTTNLVEEQKKLPSRVVPALGRVRVKSPQMVEEAVTPPCSPRKEYPIVESAVQTDDVFDDETSQLVADLAQTAIVQAIHNLQLEETVLDLKKKTEEFRLKLEVERRQKREMEKKASATIKEKEKEIAESKKREEEALASNRLAVLTCKEITEKALGRIQHLDELKPKTRSIGLDTRQLNSIREKVDLVTAELEKDFFPWMFAHAENIYRRKEAAIRMQNDQKRRRRIL